MTLMIPVSWGELIDKITILQIKMDRIADRRKLANIGRELAQLSAVRSGREIAGVSIGEQESELRAVNEALWDIEDEIRACERAQDFGSRFVELARAVYRTNDRRAELKYRINTLLDSDLVEEKSYEAY